MASFFGRHKNVLLYVPNLIGYVRVALALYSFSVAYTKPMHTIITYFASFVCDELDGRFARMLQQTSTLGAVLDMVTDRLSTTGLLMLLAVLYPNYIFGCISLVFLDIFSHWFQMYSTLLLGASTHKDVKSRSWLVRTYYSQRLFMGFCCVCCEVMYLMLYLLYFAEYQQYRWSAVRFELPQQVLDFAPWASVVFSREGMPYVAVLAFTALPGVIVKQVCNWVQLENAVQSLVEYDLKKIKKLA